VAQRIVVTGANGAVGREIVTRAIDRYGPEVQVVAAVRSERAAAQVPPIPPEQGSVAQISYEDPQTLDKALEGATALIHLPGVLIERPGATYELANVNTTELALAAAKGRAVGKVVLASAYGADPGSHNRYFKTKGLAEQAVRASGLPFTVLRVPLLLGPNTEGTRALRRETSSKTAWILSGGQTWHQPLDIGDLADALLCAALNREVASGQTLEFAGPERLRYRELLERAARLLGVRVRIRSLPRAPVQLLAAIRTRLLGPGFSPDAIEVLLTDTCVEPDAAARELGITLTPLEVTLRRSLLLPGSE
jgi:NADH dehydrogenase